MNTCECGCGGSTAYRFVRGHYQRTVERTVGYKQETWVNGKPRELHAIIAERVLGRPLPKGTQVHHVDGNKLNNATSNLVICQDAAYHQLLHYRLRVLRAGGNPNGDRICRICGPKPAAQFHRRGKSYQPMCRACHKVLDRERYLRSQAEEMRLTR
jgi:hypothetical protein